MEVRLEMKPLEVRIVAIVAGSSGVFLWVAVLLSLRSFPLAVSEEQQPGHVYVV